MSNQILVIEDKYWYHCICGMPECCMRKAKNATDLMKKSGIGVDEKDFDYDKHNEYYAYHISHLCKWPNSHLYFMDKIHCIQAIDGKGIRKDDVSEYNFTHETYKINSVVFDNILTALYRQRNHIMSLSYQLWSNDKEMYLACLPRDILRIILDKVTYDNKY
jgi:hypothetical protein